MIKEEHDSLKWMVGITTGICRLNRHLSNIDKKYLHAIDIAFKKMLIILVESALGTIVQGIEYDELEEAILDIKDLQNINLSDPNKVCY